MTCRRRPLHTTMQAGSVDVGDAEEVDDLLDRCTDLIGILHVHHHHHHEDLFARPRFTAVYLDHQLYEETVVMPALCAAVHDDELESAHTALRRSMPLDVLVGRLGVMLPAMNIGERADMLAGLSSTPADVFAIVRRAAESVLTPAQCAEVANRIGLN